MITWLLGYLKSKLNGVDFKIGMSRDFLLPTSLYQSLIVFASIYVPQQLPFHLAINWIGENEERIGGEK